MNRTPAEWITHRFGGVRKLAQAINISPSAVSRWKRGQGYIPKKREKAILVAAETLGLALGYEEILFGEFTSKLKCTRKTCNCVNINKISSEKQETPSSALAES
jgi:transcriptional regulator with XRE-family HTH domain